MAVQERILNEIKGRMLEDIVLQETQMANPKKEVFVLQFAIGEFDMVVFDPLAKTVLYRGEDQIIEGIQYRNVERYLVELDCAG